MDQQALAGARALIALHARVTLGLREMGVLRTRNAVGDFCEWLATETLQLKRMPPNATYDAEDANGLRYEIKSRQTTEGSSNELLGSTTTRFGKFKKDAFDKIVCVFINARGDVTLAFQIDHDDAVRLAYEAKNGYVLAANAATLGDPAVTDLTQRFQL